MRKRVAEKRCSSMAGYKALWSKKTGYPSKDYLKVLYGNTMTKKVYMRNLEKAVIAANYASQIEDSFTYTDADLDKYYSENKNAFR